MRGSRLVMTTYRRRSNLCPLINKGSCMYFCTWENKGKIFLGEPFLPSFENTQILTTHSSSLARLATSSFAGTTLIPWPLLLHNSLHHHHHHHHHNPNDPHHHHRQQIQEHLVHGVTLSIAAVNTTNI